MLSTPRRAPRALMAALLAVALGLTPKAQAQPMFAVPIGPEVVVLPLALLLATLWATNSKPQEASLRQLQSRRDWAGLEALANRQLAEHPGDTGWLLARAQALQMRGRCGEAIGDYTQAFDALSAPGAAGSSAELRYAAGSNLGQCQLATWRLSDALQTMQRLAAIAPERWEPDYNSGVIHALQGRPDAALTALAALRAKHPAMADALAAHDLAPDLPTEAAVPVPVEPANAAGATPAGALASNALPIGRLEIALPAGPWVLASTTPGLVRGRRPTAWPMSEVDVPVLTQTAYALDGPRLRAAFTLTASLAPAPGLREWSVGSACGTRDAIHVDRFDRSFDRPECLALRIVDARSAPGSDALAPALRAAQRSGTTLPTAAYEVHYARYGLDALVSTTWLLPRRAFAGQLAAVQWARTLGESLRPVADGPVRPVRVPDFGPP